MQSFQKFKILPVNSDTLTTDYAQSQSVKVLRALVIDDSLVCLKQLGKILVDIGFATDLFFNGGQAYAHLCKYAAAGGSITYDVIITDLNMPVMSGVVFIHKVR